MKVLEDELVYDCISWVPVSKKRLRKRGYDQVELIAKVAAEALGLPLVSTLYKFRDTPPQSSIRDFAKRRANVLGAYKPIAPETVSGKRVLLLDDVVTTGATASECARVLLTAGAKDVSFAAVAAASYHKK
jgi:predicted amidophosphoribosyltransferase